MRRFFILLPILMIFLHATASNLRVIGQHDGLSCLSVFSLHQDAFGYMWAGTYEGLNKLCGYQINVYRTGNNGTNQISGDLIEKIHEQSNGVLWIHTNLGFDRFDTRLGSIEYHPEVNGTYKSAVSAGGTVIALKSDESCLYYHKGLKHFHKAHLPKVVFSSVIFVHFNRRNELEVVQHDRVMRYGLSYDTDGNLNFKLHSTTVMPRNLQYAGFDGHKMFSVDTDYKLYESLSDFRHLRLLCRLHPEKRMYGLISAVVSDGGKLIVGFKSEDALAVDLRSGHQHPLSIPFGVYDVKLDANQQLLWIATDGGGIYTYRNEPYDFDASPFSTFPDFQVTKQARAIYHDKADNYWIGTKGNGLYCLHKSTGGQRIVRHFTSENSSLGHNMVFNVIPSPYHSLLWIGCEGDGISYFSYKDNKIHRLEVPHNQKLRCIHALVETGPQDFWAVSNWNGLFHVCLKEHNGQLEVASTKQYLYDAYNPGNSQFFTIRRQDKYKLWFASREHGIYCLYLNTGRIRHVLFARPRQDAVNDVHSVCTDIPGHVLVGTSAGLMDITEDANDRLHIHHVSQPYIGRKAIRSLVADGRNTVWASTASGLLHVDLQTGATSYYPGIGNMEFCDNASYYDALKKIFLFGGTNALLSIKKSTDYVRKRFHPSVIFEGIGSGEQSFPMASFMNDRHQLVLQHDQTYFNINYNALDYLSGESYLYEYRISNVVSKWRSNGNMHSISLVGLPSGNYKIEVRYRQGDYVSKPYMLGLVIKPAWYASPIAKALYLILALSMIAYVIYEFFKRQQLRHERALAELELAHKKDLYESKLDFFTSLAHEFSKPLMLISGPSRSIAKSALVDEKNRSHAGIIYHNASLLKDLTQKLIDFRKLDTSDRKPEVSIVDVSAVLSKLVERFSSFASWRQIKFHYTISDDIEWVTDENALTTICSNLLSLILKHLPVRGSLELSVCVAEGNLLLDYHSQGYHPHVELLSDYTNKYQVVDTLENQTLDEGEVFDELDLAICQSLLQMVGGSLHMLDGEMQEARFRLIFPPIQPSDKDMLHPLLNHNELNTAILTIPQLAQQSEKMEQGRQNILFINSDEEMRWYIQNFLSDHFNVTTCSNSEEAHHIMGLHLPDLVITDLLIKQQTGIEFCREMKHNNATKHIPVILLSSIYSEDIRQESIDAGADICITMPYDEDNFLSVVSGILRHQETIMNYHDNSLSSFELVDGVVMHKEEHQMMEKMMQIINDNLGNPKLSIPMIADQMGIGVRNLYRFLDKMNVEKPSEIIRNMRLKRASYLLTHTNLTVEEVAFKCGFNNRSTFHHIFVKSFGCSPRQYHDKSQQNAKKIMNEGNPREYLSSGPDGMTNHPEKEDH